MTIVEAADARHGHAPQMPSEMSGERWCIIGGGMLGLSLAHKLSAPNRAVTVLEASDRLGGLADAWRLGPVTWDRHYHVTLLSDQNLRAVLADIGLEDELVWTVTKTDFYTKERFHPLNNVVDYLRFPVLGLIDKARLAFTILYGSRIKNGVRLESVPVEKWLTRWSGRRTYQEIWKPLLRAKLGENHTRVSASFIWSVIKRFYGARRSGLKTEMFGYVDGGYRRIVEAFEAHLTGRNVSIHNNAPVLDIRKEGDDGFLVKTPSAEAERFDRVILTVPGPIAACMCPALSKAEISQLTSLRYQGVVCASVLLKRPLRGRYLTYIADESIPFTGVIEMTAVVDPKAFGGTSLVYLPHYVPSDHALFDTPDAEIETSCMRNLMRMYPHITEDDVMAIRVSKAPHVLAIQSLNYSRNVLPFDTSIGGLHLVNSTQIINGNLNVDETVALANEAACHLLALPARQTVQGRHEKRSRA